MKTRLPLLLLTAFALVACGGSGNVRERQEALDAWENRVRWSAFETLVDFIHPEWLDENPVTELDLERLNQFRVTEYRVRAILADPDGQSLERRARIRLVNVHNHRERVIDHLEVWRYDDERKRWLLHSGLPDPRRY
ncbi:MAG: hypothetical protein EA370_03775 [Wenzhouxiangella sp.]|nr:MAG: hypothetical protein EA370_03775 [Wenzhouxiangella sp.]